MKKFSVFVIAVMLSLTLTSPGLATVKLSDTLDFGMTLYLDTYYYHADKQYKAYGLTVGQTTKGEDFDRFDAWFNNLSIFILRWHNEENVGIFLIPYLDGENNNLGVAFCYGYWNITPNLKLQVGKGTTSFSELQPEGMLGGLEGKAVGIGYGNYFSGYNVYGRVEYKFGNWGLLKAGIVDPRITDGVYVTAPGFKSNGGAVDNVTVLPKFELALPLYIPIPKTLGSLEVQTSSFWNKQTFDNVQGPDKDITSYGLCLGLNTRIYPTQNPKDGYIRLMGEINYGQNWYNSRGYGYPVSPNLIVAGVTSAYGAKVDNSGKIQDSTNLGWWVQAGYHTRIKGIGDIEPAFIFGSQTADRTVNNLKDQIGLMQYGAILPITVNPYLTIAPAFMIFDNGINTLGGVRKDFGKEWVVGIDFALHF